MNTDTRLTANQLAVECEKLRRKLAAKNETLEKLRALIWEIGHDRPRFVGDGSTGDEYEWIGTKADEALLLANQSLAEK